MDLLTWFFLMGASFRLTRLVTTDDITERPRTWLISKIGEDSKIATLLTCNWCVGIYITFGVFAEYLYLGIVPIWIHAALTAAATVGYLGIFDD